MPQLVPFYFKNEVTFAFVLLISMIYTLSKYTLPRFVRLFAARVFLTKS
nr:ATP synthase subunit 8 [Stereocaulon pileatum]WBP63150.1 ATP synthase subunit 8 [Stereocaulon pileatum]